MLTRYITRLYCFHPDMIEVRREVVDPNIKGARVAYRDNGFWGVEVFYLVPPAGVISKEITSGMTGGPEHVVYYTGSLPEGAYRFLKDEEKQGEMN